MKTIKIKLSRVQPIDFFLALPALASIAHGIAQHLGAH